MRFTRGLLQSIHLSMWSCLPLCLWVSGLGPSSVETIPEKISSRSAFPRGWELGFIGGEKSKSPSGTKGSQPACVLKPLFGRNGLASPKGDLQICSEVGNSRGRVLVPDCPLPASAKRFLEIFSQGQFPRRCGGPRGPNSQGKEKPHGQVYAL